MCAIPKTKIICTIGPKTETYSEIKKLADAGMSVARINFSHGNYEQYARMITNIRKVSHDIGIMIDTKGPEIRTGLIEDNTFLKKGQKFVLTTRKIIGNKNEVYVDYSYLPEQVKKGSTILLDDGEIELQVIKVKENNMNGKNADGKDVICNVINSGGLSNRKRVTIPGQDIKVPSVTKKDERDINFGLRQGVDFIAASFVREAKDILKIRKLLKSHNHIKIIAKIECQKAVNNIDSIIEAADGIMVARGDLGVEMLPEEVPIIQKKIIEKCNLAGKPVITATQMLKSMVTSKRPTRAEASDVANAILDGTDAVMLSEETAIGNYPVQAVKMMTRIAAITENSLTLQRKISVKTNDDAIANAVYDIADSTEVNKIIACTYSGHSARMISKYRPKAEIIAVTPEDYTIRQLSLIWGARPVRIIEEYKPKIKTTRELIYYAVLSAFKKGMIKKEEKIIVTAAFPLNIRARTNLLEIYSVKEILEYAK